MLAILISWLLGIRLVLVIESYLKQQIDRLLLIPFSLLLGCLATGLFLLMCSWLSLEWSRFWVLSSLLVFIALGSRFSDESLGTLLSDIREWRPDTYLKISLVGIVLLGIFLMASVLQTRFLHSDALSNWFFRGKIFFIERGIDRQVLSSDEFVDFVPELGSFLRVKYPPLPSLMVAWVSLVAGSFSVIQAKIFYVLLILLMLYIVTIEARRLLSPRLHWSLVYSLLLLSLPAFSHTFSFHWFGNATLWMCSFYLLGIVALNRFMDEGASIYLLLGSLILGGAAFTKTEGVVAWWFIFFILYHRKQVSSALWASCIAFLILPGVLWHVFALGISEPGAVLYGTASNLFTWDIFVHRFLEAVMVVLETLFDLRFFLLLWPVFLGSVLIGIVFKLFSVRLMILEGVIFVAIAFLCAAIIGVSVEISALAYMPRYVAQWVPSACYLVIVNHSLFRQKINV